MNILENLRKKFIRGLRGFKGPFLPTINKHGKGQKLRSNILLRSGLVNYSFHFSENRKAFICMIFGLMKMPWMAIINRLMSQSHPCVVAVAWQRFIFLKNTYPQGHFSESSNFKKRLKASRNIGTHWRYGMNPWFLSIRSVFSYFCDMTLHFCVRFVAWCLILLQFVLRELQLEPSLDILPTPARHASTCMSGHAGSKRACRHARRPRIHIYE